MKNFCFFIFVLAGLPVDCRGWNNEYDGDLYFVCPSSESISSLTSQHSNKHEDRIWEMYCKHSFDTGPSECFWSEYANWFDEEFLFYCPSNYIISGMQSYHHNHHEDRRWKFYCCKLDGICNHNCYWTSYVNNFDEQFTFHVPYLNYLAGAGSYHSNKHEDRRWRYLHCARSSC